MRYVVDRSKFYFHLIESGFSNLGAVAKHLQLNRGTLTAYVTGERDAVSSTVVELAKLFGVSPMELLKVELTNNETQNHKVDQI